MQCRDFLAEIAKETDAHNLTFAALEENEHNVQKLHTWLEKIARVTSAVPSGLPLLPKRLRRASVPCMVLRRRFTPEKASRDRRRRSPGTSSAALLTCQLRYV